MGIKKIIITGADGQLGNALKNISGNCEGFEWLFCGRKDLDITDNRAVEDLFERTGAEGTVLINCAAYTDVEKAETEQDRAYRINRDGVRNLAEAVQRAGMKLIHISTDFVFDGLKGSEYNENDKPAPLSVYGKSKLEGENELLKFPENCMIIRTSWLYSTTHNTFMKKVYSKLREGVPFNVVSDEIGSPTNAVDLADAIITILKRPYVTENFKTDIFHFCNTGSVSRYEYAKKISGFSGTGTGVLPITSDGLKMKAKRPKNSSLDNSKIKEVFGLKIRSWEAALAEAVGILNAE